MSLEERMVDSALAHAAAVELRSVIRGDVFAPDDTDYETARLPWQRTVQQHPAVIVAAQDADDVVAVVRFAAAHEMPVAIMRTGHGMVAPCDGGLLLLTERMQGAEVDPVARVARIPAGALWRDVLAQSIPHGLAPLLGSTPYVGAIGYTLGGGMGWLARKFGLAVDTVRAFDIVTADGRLRRVTPESEPDLFWAVRGSGSNFGVVTSLECELYPVGDMYGGNLFYPIEAAAEVLAAYSAWVKTLPDEFTTAFLTLRFPDIPDIPPPLAGKTFAVVRGCYVGWAARGEALLRPMRQAALVAVDAFTTLNIGELEGISSDPVDPMPVFSWTETLNDLGPETAQALLRLHESAPDVPFFAIEARHVGGSAAIRAPRDNAFSLRGAEFVLFIYGLFPAPELGPAIKSYLGQVTDTLKPHATGMQYYNFLSETDMTPERGRATHTPAHNQRLAALKAVYDPANLFRYNPNIPPAGPAIAH